MFVNSHTTLNPRRQTGGKKCHTIVGFKQPKDDVDAGNFLLFVFLDFSYRDIELLV
jgi:hypothetical protein